MKTLSEKVKMRDYTRYPDAVGIPSLTSHQIEAYQKFLQLEKSFNKRLPQGLEGIFRETFPIQDINKNWTLEYSGYELGKPRYSHQEAKELGQTYGIPVRLRLRLVGKDILEETVYLCDLPLILGGGEFVVHGVERIVVSQMHRAPGADFTEEKIGDQKFQRCTLVTERGNWLEIGVTKRDTLYIRIDPSTKIPLTLFLRCLSDSFATTEGLLQAFYGTKKIFLSSKTVPSDLVGLYMLHTLHAKNESPQEASSDLPVLIRAGEKITETVAKRLLDQEIKEIEVIDSPSDVLMLNTVAEDPIQTQDEAFLKLYTKLRPTSPSDLKNARQAFHDRFLDINRFRIGTVGRFKMNRKFKVSIPESKIGLLPEDMIHIVQYLIKIRRREGEVDDIDSLANRRIRMIDELLAEEMRRGLYRLRNLIQEKLNSYKEESKEKLTPKGLINSKTVSASVDYFFMRGELSQYADQSNPLAQLTHERRLSALGPGGLDRKHTGFEVRDVHTNHYGRICPIETPEGANIGLIASRAIFSNVDRYGFLVTPFRKVEKGRVTDDVVYLRADEEMGKVVAPADTSRNDQGKITLDKIPARLSGETVMVSPDEVHLMDISSKQILGVSASLIPFLEHDDANRALMGSNMQRQSVPLIAPQPALVITGMEQPLALNTGMVVRSKEEGVVRQVDARSITVDDHIYELRKFIGTNDKTCINQKPLVSVGEKVKAGQVLTEGGGTAQGELALGANFLVAFMPWEGYNFEDAIVVSERVVEQDALSSIHVEEFKVELRETKLGREEFTRDIPNVNEKLLASLDENGLVRIGTFVKPGDILVGKVAPKKRTELTPEEKLLYAIFGKAGEEVKNESLYVPPGIEGVVIRTRHLSRKVGLEEKEKNQVRAETKRLTQEYDGKIQRLLDSLLEQLRDLSHKRLTLPKYGTKEVSGVASLKGLLEAKFEEEGDPMGQKAKVHIARAFQVLEDLEIEKNNKVNQVQRGDELPTGILEMVKVYIATKKNIKAGDKISGRHGNKGVVAKILPVEDMPHLEDGTPVDMVLNPLGVPSRMNIGQLLETHIGWAARKLGVRILTPPFAGATEQQVQALLSEAGLPEEGKVALYDGRTGESFKEKVTVGVLYIMKLHHLVTDKIHARATGPYSLITQQPLGGRARYGGQRFGEMEVWALEAYGTAHLLQEMLTVKSDDVDGRTRIYESIIKGRDEAEPGIPASFEVLLHELRGLGLDVRLEK